MSSISYPSLSSPLLRKLRRPQRENLQDIETALWAAYRRHDRSAVMQKLLQRHLRVGRGRARSSRKA